MSYFAPYLDEGGIHLPSYAERLEDLIAGYRKIFGSDVYIEPDTMDYQLLSIVAKCWDDLGSVLLDNYNSRNPNYATDSALDLLVPLNGIVRKQATSSSAVLTLTGTAGVTLPAGLQAIDIDSHVWQIQEPVTFNNEGKATATAYCTETGAIAAGIGAINEINTAVVHWYGVTNEAPAILGNEIETDAQLRKRRSASVSLPSRSIMSGIVGALVNVSGVNSVNVVENRTSTPGDIPAHSICAVVDGGEDADIAEVLWLKKAPGCGLSGTEAVIYVDEYNHENEIRFSRPTKENVKVSMTLRIFAEFEPTLLSEDIPRVVSEYINSLGVGENLIVGLLHGIIFSANKAAYPIFSISNLYVAGHGESVQSDTLVAPYDYMWKNAGTVTTLTETSPNVWVIEVE